MTFFQLIFVPICAVLAAATLYRIKLGHLGRRQGLLWAIIWTIAAVLIASPGSTAVVASWLEIDRGADLIFYLGILAGLAACLSFYGWMRRLEIIVTELARHEAIRNPRYGDPDAPRSKCEDGA